jgi:hypothetical protein
MEMKQAKMQLSIPDMRVIIIRIITDIHELREQTQHPRKHRICWSGSHHHSATSSQGSPRATVVGPHRLNGTGFFIFDLSWGDPVLRRLSCRRDRLGSGSWKN